MPVSSLTRALLVRFFGTKRLLIGSILRVAGLLLLLGTLPAALTYSFWLIYWLFACLSYFVVLGLIAYILPGVLIALFGVALGGGFLTLVGWGYFTLAVRYYNWLRSTYKLAQDDLALNALFAGGAAADAR